MCGWRATDAGHAVALGAKSSYYTQYLELKSVPGRREANPGYRSGALRSPGLMTIGMSDDDTKIANLLYVWTVHTAEHPIPGTQRQLRIANLLQNYEASQGTYGMWEMSGDIGLCTVSTAQDMVYILVS